MYNRLELDYMDIKPVDSERNIGDAEQVVKYYNKRKDSYEVVVKEGQFERPIYHVENLSERDADQLLETSREIDITKILE